MNAQELHELVEYHHDVWKDHLVWSKDEKRWWSGPCGDDLRACWPIPSELAEAALIGLFVVATGYSVRKTVCESRCLAWVAEAPWKPAHHGHSPLEALVRVRDNERKAT